MKKSWKGILIGVSRKKKGRNTIHAEEHTLGSRHLGSWADCELISFSNAFFFLFPDRLWIYQSVFTQCHAQPSKTSHSAG